MVVIFKGQEQPERRTRPPGDYLPLKVARNPIPSLQPVEQS